MLAMDRPWTHSGLKICTVDERGRGSLLVQRTARLRAKSINQSFLYAHLKDSSFTKHCKPTETTVPHISIKDIQTFQVLCPPEELQTSFARIAEKAERIKSSYQQSLTDLESLYGALSQQAFKGELDLSRVPSPGIQAEEVKPVASEPLKLPSETGRAINLPHEYDFLDGPATPEARKALLTLWLEDCRRQFSEPFTVQNFMAAALTRMEELEPEFDYAFNVSDYEYIKVWVFEALAAGTLTQAFNDTGNLIEVKAVQA